MINAKKTRVRIAGNAKNIRKKEPSHWRCFIGNDTTEHKLNSWKLVGVATENNVMPGTNPDGDEFGLVAWIDLYGDVIITDEKKAIVHLLTW
ncbi:MAG: hypothetical protein WDZ88_00390 [Candidatus Paceibacterota bacterium]